MSEAQHLQRLPEKALDALYDSLSVQIMPNGRYDGRAWVHGHPVIGWLASLVWRGKVFEKEDEYDLRVLNRLFGMRLIEGWAGVEEGLDGKTIAIFIDYWRLGLVDYVRQVSPTLYLGRMQWRRWTVHFTLSQR